MRKEEDDINLNGDFRRRSMGSHWEKGESSEGIHGLDRKQEFVDFYMGFSSPLQKRTKKHQSGNSSFEIFWLTITRFQLSLIP